MQLGTRRIRSAGRTSGSIEITLPASLQGLKGINCHLVVRDGPRPEIVLQPDLTPAQGLFQFFWKKMQLCFSEIGELPEFSLTHFTPTFFSIQPWQERPPLAYTDALAMLQQQNDDANALTRLLSSLAIGAGYQLGLQGQFALAFGDSVGYLITGNSTNLGTDFERGMAHRILGSEGQMPQPFTHPFDNHEWQMARTPFRRVFDQFLTWQNAPDTCAAARDNWYRALTLELKTI